MPDKQTAYVLEDDGSGVGVGQYFVGFPNPAGGWMIDEPVAVNDLGLTAKDAEALVKETGVPLKKTSAVPVHKDGPNPFVSSAELPSEPLGLGLAAVAGEGSGVVAGERETRAAKEAAS